MKYLIIFLCLWMANARAIPVFNENASDSGLMTIYPDNIDSNLFYIAPNVMTTCHDQDGQLMFFYSEYRPNWYSPLHAIVQLTICPQYLTSELEKSMNSIRAKLPQARFAGLPFLKSEIDFNPVLAPFVIRQSCSHVTSTIGAEQSCSFEFNGQGREVFLAQIERGLTMVMQFRYQVAGVLRDANKNWINSEIEHSLAVRIGGTEFRGHLDLL
jgi:hypothetical protein